MAIETPKGKVSAIATVGAPADPLAALRWRASSHESVKKIDAQIAALFKKLEVADEAFRAERAALDTQREAALKAAMRELVG